MSRAAVSCPSGKAFYRNRLGSGTSFLCWGTAASGQHSDDPPLKLPEGVSLVPPKHPAQLGGHAVAEQQDGAEGIRGPPSCMSQTLKVPASSDAAPTSWPACLVLQQCTWEALQGASATQYGFVGNTVMPVATTCLVGGRNVAVLSLHVMGFFLWFGIEETCLSQACSNPHPGVEASGRVPLQRLGGSDSTSTPSLEQGEGYSRGFICT